MVMFRILAIGVWIFALLIFVGGLSTDFLTCTIVALIIALNTLIPSSQSPGARKSDRGDSVYTAVESNQAASRRPREQRGWRHDAGTRERENGQNREMGQR